MTIPSGERLGPYEVLERIGAGGMGEVYRARDTRLGRYVAIKVLTGDVAGDAARVRRFEVEMKAVGRLNHPNVLAVHDVGTRDGVPYLVSELLDGETLRDRLDRGPLPRKELVATAVAIAAGLAAAHAASVVHRDLKPENVFLTRDGRVKLLDFGLAKLVEAPAPLSFGDVHDAETAQRLTVSGFVVGTVRYMSPEQIKGAPLDHRSDIFSFGTVLFEMATGEVAFRRGSAIETMTATLRDDPLTSLKDPARIPPSLEPILRRCLEKSPDERYQSAADLAFSLRDLADEVAGASTRRRRALPGSRAVVATPWRLAAGALLLVALGAAAFVAGRASKETVVPAFRQLTFRRGAVLSARFTPDGQSVVFGAAWEGAPFRIYSRRLESPETRPLEMPEGDVLAVSPSGELAVALGRRFVYGFSARGKLARAPLEGGAPRELLDDVEDADWSPDGSELAVSRVVDGHHRVELPIGRVLHRSEGWVSNVRVSPDGKRVAFVDHPVLGDDRGSICVVERSGQKEVLSSGWTSALGLAWAPSGREVWFTASDVSPNCALWAVSLSGEKRLLARGAGRLCLQDVRPDGRVLVTEGRVRIGMAFGTASGTNGAKGERDISWLDVSVVADLSADGKTVLFGEQGAGAGAGTYAVYARGSDGSPAVKLGEGTAGSLSPDGRWAISIVPSSPPKLLLLPLGAGETRTLERGPLSSYQAACWFPDGKRLLLAANEPGQKARLYVQEVDGGALTPLPDPGTRIAPGADAVSPDGKLAAALDADDRVVLVPLDGSPAPKAPGLPSGEIPIRWSRDGSSLYVFRYDERPVRIRKVDLATGTRQVVAETAPPDPAGIESVVSAQVTPDGTAYVYSFFQYRTDLHLVIGLP